jgi:hypothetical protein
MLEGWPYARILDSSEERAAALPNRLHTYHHCRAHT